MTVIFENHSPFKKQNKQAHKKLLGGENDAFVLMLLTLSVKRERIDKPEVFFLKRHTKTLSQLCALLFYLGKSCKRYTTSHIFHYCNANAISITNTWIYCYKIKFDLKWAIHQGVGFDGIFCSYLQLDIYGK